MLSKGLQKRLGNSLCTCVALFASQLTLAGQPLPDDWTPAASDIVDNQNGSGPLRLSAQSVLKSTDDNEIIIKINNTPMELGLAQNTPETPKAEAAPAVSSAEQKGLFRIYRSNLLKKTYQHVSYPESAIDRNQQGDVILKLTIDRNGKIKDVKYDKRADFSSLNKAAARAVKNAKPYPAAPKRLNGESFEVIMPIRFRLAG